MTDTIFFSPRSLPFTPAHPVDRRTTTLPEYRPLQPAPTPLPSTLPFVPEEDRVSQGMLLGLMAVTLATAAYSLVQVWHLAGGDTLSQAVHAFLL